MSPFAACLSNGSAQAWRDSPASATIIVTQHQVLPQIMARGDYNLLPPSNGWSGVSLLVYRL